MSRITLIQVAALCLIIAAAGCAGSNRTSKKEKDETVEVGYGTQKESEVTGAVSTIGKDEIEKKPVTRIEDLIQGRIPGVTITEGAGGELKILIRGRSSLSANTDPLIVIDGVPMNPGAGSGLSNINKNDIESITVLKDASSTAIYGTRGANGVILIKTKRGQMKP